MNRCPKCNRAESDDSLAFCRADGTRLVSDGSFVSEGAGTLRFDSAPATEETETCTLPTGETLSRPTAATRVLDGHREARGTKGIGQAKVPQGGPNNGCRDYRRHPRSYHIPLPVTWQG